MQTHVPATNTNTNKSRKTGAIVLYSSKNRQGSWYFMSLDKGTRIHRYTWEILPIGIDVINIVSNIRRSEDQPIVASNFRFQWGPDGEDIDDDSDLDDDDEDDDVLLSPPNMLIIDKDEVETSDEQIDDVDEELGAQDNDNNDDSHELDEYQDDDDNMLIEDDVEDACHDLDINEKEDAVVEDVYEQSLEYNDDNNTRYKSKSGRVVKRQD